MSRNEKRESRMKRGDLEAGHDCATGHTQEEGKGMGLMIFGGTTKGGS